MTLFEKLLGHTLITADNIWGLMGVMCIGVALSIFLEQKYQWASKVSGAIIALIMAMVLANLGVIPTNSALYDACLLYTSPSTRAGLLSRKPSSA